MGLYGHQFDFYIINQLKVRVFTLDDKEIVGFIQRYSTTCSESPDEDDFLQIGDLSLDEYNLMRKGPFHLIPLKKIKSLEAAAIRDIKDSSLPEDSRREVLGWLRPFME